MKHRIVNPESVPIVRVDCDLPALSCEGLTADFLRASFRCPPTHWETVANERPLSTESQVMRQAAVLLPLVENRFLQGQGGHADDAEGFSVLLMQRSMQLRTHPGQISLPGGKMDEGDESLVETALRETYEEIGLDAEKIDVLGMMPAYTSISAFEITPVVGIVRDVMSLKLSEDEVVGVFTVPLSFLMNPAQHCWHEYHFKTEDGFQHTRKWLSMNYVDGDKSYFIWGVTAAIIRNFYLYLHAFECDL